MTAHDFNRTDAVIQSLVFALLWAVMIAIQFYTAMTIQSFRIDTRARIQVIQQEVVEGRELARVSRDRLETLLMLHQVQPPHKLKDVKTLDDPIGE